MTYNYLIKKTRKNKKRTKTKKTKMKSLKKRFFYGGDKFTDLKDYLPENIIQKYMINEGDLKIKGTNNTQREYDNQQLYGKNSESTSNAEKSRIERKTYNWYIIGDPPEILTEFENNIEKLDTMQINYLIDIYSKYMIDYPHDARTRLLSKFYVVILQKKQKILNKRKTIVHSNS